LLLARLRLRNILSAKDIKKAEIQTALSIYTLEHNPIAGNYVDRKSYLFRTLVILILCSFLITFIELQSYQVIPLEQRPMLFQNYETSVFLGLLTSFGGALILHLTMGNTFWFYILMKTLTVFLAVFMPNDISTQNLKPTALLVGTICLALCGTYVYTFYQRVALSRDAKKAILKTSLTFLFSFIPILGTFTYWQPLFQKKVTQ
jgi:hypothetical protein